MNDNVEPIVKNRNVEQLLKKIKILMIFLVIVCILIVVWNLLNKITLLSTSTSSNDFFNYFGYVFMLLADIFLTVMECCLIRLFCNDIISIYNKYYVNKRRFFWVSLVISLIIFCVQLFVFLFIIFSLFS